MRTIPLKTLSAGPDGSAKLTTISLISECAGFAGERGISTEDQFAGVKMLNSLSQTVTTAKPSLLLEEAEWCFLVRKINEMRWARLDPAIVEIITDIRGAKQFDPNAAA